MTADLSALVVECRAWKDAGKRLVLTNGCFDLMHPGHLALLEESRSLGDVLIVALNSDRSVREIKGPRRPIVTEAERVETLRAFEAVDRVLVYDEPTPLHVVEALVPDVLVKGADWGPGTIVGTEVVEAAGGRVARVALRPGQSTSALLERIRRR